MAGKSFNWNEEFAKRWHQFMPPARPSEAEMNCYEQALRSEAKRDGAKRNATRWALLGSTPEIRSLAGRYQREILCIDRNAGVFEALREMSHPNPLEQFHCSDWLEADLPNGADVILGDGSLNMLPPAKHEGLLRNIHNMLKPQGLALLRVHVITPAEFESPRAIFDWYRATNSHKPVFFFTKTHLDMLWFEPDTLKIDLALFYKNIQQLYQEDIINEAELEGYSKLIKDLQFEHYYMRREVFENVAKKYFQIEDMLFGGDYPGFMSHPIYVLRKKD